MCVKSDAPKPYGQETDVLQFSGLLAGDVEESRNDSPTRDLQMAADRTRPHTLCGPVVSSLFFFRYAMLRSCWRSAVSTSTTRRSGAGCSITALSWSSDCEGISSRQTSLGEWTTPTVRPANVARLYGGALLEHVWDAVLDDFAIRACLFSAARENEPKRR